MTKKKFIKTLRAYRLDRDDINHLVNKIVERKGKLSYNDAMQKMWLTIRKQIINKQPPLAIDWNYKPLEFVDTDIYKMDYNILSIDLAIQPDRTITVRSTAD